jgi:hypothetical protein
MARPCLKKNQKRKNINRQIDEFFGKGQINSTNLFLTFSSTKAFKNVWRGWGHSQQYAHV